MKYVSSEEKTVLTICNLPACDRNKDVADNLFFKFSKDGQNPNLTLKGVGQNLHFSTDTLI